MKPNNHFFIMCLTFCLWLVNASTYAQNVGINTTGAAPHTSAMLDIVNSNKGLLIPRVALTGTDDVTTISSPALSLMVFNTNTVLNFDAKDVLPGFYYWDGTKWIAFGGTGGKDWSLLGNAGTIDTTQFLGTTDNVALNFRVNNKKAGRIDPAGSTFFGYQAGNSNTANLNTGFGYQALFTNITGNGNVAVGYQALFANTTGFENTAIGYQAMLANTTGSFNVATGSMALARNTTGSNNTAFGAGALQKNRTGSNNTAFGAGALGFPTGNTGSNNVAIGTSALVFNQASNNVAIGNFALPLNTTGSFNVATGHYASYFNNVGSYHVATGDSASFFIAGGSNYNVITGSSAGLNLFTGSNNTISGYKAGYGSFPNSSICFNSSLFGYRAGFNLNGNIGNNIFIGYQAGDAVTTGSNNIVIGYDIDAPSPTAGRQMSIGNLIFGTGVVATGTAVSTGSIGIGINNPNYILHVNGTTAYTSNVVTSDARKKKNIQPLALNGISIINQLKPVTFEWQDVLDEGMRGTQMGFIAQDLEKVLPGIVVTQQDADQTKGVKYNELLPVFAKARQEQHIQIDQFNDTLQQQNEALKQENEVMRKAIGAMKKQNEVILNALSKHK